MGAVASFKPAFSQHIHECHMTGYRPTINTHETHDDDVVMLHGEINNGQRFKTYNKTNQRIRVECEFKKGAFRPAGLSRYLEDNNNSFVELYQVVASVCVEKFNQLLASRDITVDDNDYTPEDFLLRLGQACRNQDRAKMLLGLLVNTGRVTSRFGYSYIRSLVDNGILARIVRGVYTVTPEWQTAIQQLRFQMGNVQGEIVV